MAQVTCKLVRQLEGQIKSLRRYIVRRDQEFRSCIEALEREVGEQAERIDSLVREQAALQEGDEDEGWIREFGEALDRA